MLESETIMYIASIDVRHIQGFIFQSDKLRFMRNASAALDTIEDGLGDLATTAGGRLLYAAGGRAKACFDTEEAATCFAASAAKRYRDIGATITATVCSPGSGPCVADLIQETERDLARAKYRQVGVTETVSAPPLEISYIGAGPAERRVQLAPGEDHLVTRECDSVLTNSWARSQLRDWAEELNSELHLGLDGVSALDGVWPTHPEQAAGAAEGDKGAMMALCYFDVNRMGEWWSSYNGNWDDLAILVNAIRDALRESFIEAVCSVMVGGLPMPLLPLLLGGDDLAFLCPAGEALQLVRELSREFEQRTAASQQDLDSPGSRICLLLDDCERLSLGTGVGIAKASFPLSLLFQITKSLQRNAKRLARLMPAPEEHSTVDFMVLHSAYALDVGEARQLMQGPDARAYCRPYFCGADTPNDAPHLEQLLEARGVLRTASADAKLTQGDIKSIHEAMLGPEDAGDLFIRERLRAGEKENTYHAVIGKFGLSPTTYWPVQTYPHLDSVAGGPSGSRYAPFSDVAETYSL